MSALQLTLVVVLLGPAEDAMRTAAEHVAAKDFDAARRVLDEAYAADPRPELLYSRAQVERLAGNCDDAKQLYEEFAQTASDVDAADARRLSTQCTPAEPAAETPPETPEPEPPPPTVVRVPEPVQPREPAPKPWSRRPLPAALMGTGAGALVAGAGLLGYAAANPADPAQADNEGHYGTLVDETQRLQTAGVVALAVGTGLAVSAGVVWGVLARRQRKRSSKTANRF